MAKLFFLAFFFLNTCLFSQVNISINNHFLDSLKLLPLSQIPDQAILSGPENGYIENIFDSNSIAFIDEDILSNLNVTPYPTLKEIKKRLQISKKAVKITTNPKKIECIFESILPISQAKSLKDSLIQLFDQTFAEKIMHDFEVFENKKPKTSFKLILKIIEKGFDNGPDYFMATIVDAASNRFILTHDGTFINRAKDTSPEPVFLNKNKNFIRFKLESYAYKNGKDLVKILGFIPENSPNLSNTVLFFPIFASKSNDSQDIISLILNFQKNKPKRANEGLSILFKLQKNYYDSFLNVN